MALKDQEILFSKSVKAGKRIYYLDVKKNRKDELFLAITESKKVTQNSFATEQVTFEKHKIFLYKEDFENFLEGLLDVLAYIGRENNENKLENMKLEDIGNLITSKLNATKE
jgi:hypothetical protein